MLHALPLLTTACSSSKGLDGKHHAFQHILDFLNPYQAACPTNPIQASPDLLVKSA